MAIKHFLMLFLPVFSWGCAPKRHGHGHVHGHHHRFDKADEWVGHFDDASRDAWQKPDEVVAALNLAPDARVADLGAGTGYFSVRLAKAMPQGVVYGLDVEPDMTRHLTERASKMGLSNVQAVTLRPDAFSVPQSVDVVLCVNTWHHIENRGAYLQTVAKNLRPGGRVVIVDFTKQAPEGPPMEMRLSPEAVEAEFTSQGFVRVTSFDFLPRQYGLVFVWRPSTSSG